MPPACTVGHLIGVLQPEQQQPTRPCQGSPSYFDYTRPWREGRTAEHASSTAPWGRIARVHTDKGQDAGNQALARRSRGGRAAAEEWWIPISRRTNAQWWRPDPVVREDMGSTADGSEWRPRPSRHQWRPWLGGVAGSNAFIGGSEGCGRHGVRGERGRRRR